MAPVVLDFRKTVNHHLFPVVDDTEDIAMFAESFLSFNKKLYSPVRCY